MKNAIKFVLKISIILTFVMTIFSLVSFFFGVDILSLNFLVGPSFYKCQDVYYILCLLPPLYSLVTILCSQSLLILNKQKQYSLIYFTTSIITFVVGYYLVKNYTYVGAALIVPLAMGLMFVTMGGYLLFTLSKTKQPYDYSNETE